MKGDFSRLTFDPTKHFASVRMQQGRVQLDSDWNEAEDIRTYLDRTQLVDLIGGCGTSIGADGIAHGFRLTVSGTTIAIEPGRYYVDAILCENERSRPFADQDDYPGAALPTAAGTYLLYLDVTERHVTALEDDGLREPALGGPDTATRLKTQWQVRWTRVGDAGATVACPTASLTGADVLQPSDATLAAFADSPDDTETCTVRPGARYQRLENQLYRVEVHDAGDFGGATFKWSRDNGSVVTHLVDVDTRTVTVESAGPDRVLGFASGQFVEVTDTRRELLGLPGTMVQIERVEGDDLIMTAASPLIDLTQFDDGRKVRRWDSRFPLRSTDFLTDGSLALEDGVRVTIKGTHFNSGDYWMVPARTNLGDVIWPRSAPTFPIPLPPAGVIHHRCRLGLFSRSGAGAWTLVADCRDQFPPLTVLDAMAYLAGDGQDVTPGPGLGSLPVPVPPAVGIMRGHLPVAGARVRFHVETGAGALTNGTTTQPVTTGADGIATTSWALDPTTPVQTLSAVHLDAADVPIGPPITFNARLLTADVVAYSPSCPDLEGATTVQAAIDALCKRPSGGSSCCWSIGDGGDLPTMMDGLKQARERGIEDVCLCLRPGQHPWEFGTVGGFRSVRIGGAGRGSIVVPTTPFRFEGIPAVTISDISVVARSMDFVFDFVTCAAVALSDDVVTMVEAPDSGRLIGIEGSAVVRISRSDLAVVMGKDDGGDLLMKAELPPQFKAAVDIIRAEPDAAAMAVRLAPVFAEVRTDRQPILAMTRAAISEDRSLRASDRTALNRLARALESDQPPAPAALEKLATDIRRLGDLTRADAGAPRGVAIAFRDALADAWLDGNRLRGDLVLYGTTAQGGVDPNALKALTEITTFKPVLPRPERGRLRVGENALDRIVLSDEWIGALQKLASGDDRALDGVPKPFREVVIASNSLSGAPQSIVGGGFTASGNTFEVASGGLIGLAIAGTSSVVGNTGPDGGARLLVGSPAAAEAANVAMTVGP